VHTGLFAAEALGTALPYRGRRAYLVVDDECPAMSPEVNQGIVGDTAKLIMHRLIVRRMRHDPTLVENARVTGPVEHGDWSLICSGRKEVWFYCVLSYDDFMQTRRDAGFCWKWQNIGNGMAWRPYPQQAGNMLTAARPRQFFWNRP
jgi:hypothetical protein